MLFSFPLPESKSKQTEKPRKGNLRIVFPERKAVKVKKMFTLCSLEGGN